MNLEKYLISKPTNEIVQFFETNIGNELLCECDKQKMKAEINAFIEELKNIKSVPCETLHKIAVVRYMFDVDDESQPVYTYDCFKTDGYNEERVELVNWEELIGMEILDKSIKEYGLDRVIFEILSNMCLFGTKHETNECMKKEFLKEFNENEKTFEEKCILKITQLLIKSGASFNQIDSLSKIERILSFINNEEKDYILTGLK